MTWIYPGTCNTLNSECFSTIQNIWPMAIIHWNSYPYSIFSLFLILGSKCYHTLCVQYVQAVKSYLYLFKPHSWHFLLSTPHLPNPHPPKKKSIKFSSLLCLHTRYIYLLCDDMQNKNSFTFLSRFTWFRLAGLAFSLGLCFVTIALIFPRIKNLLIIIYHFFLNYNKIPNCLSLQWRKCLIEFFLDSHH